jgi:hypothetical protein
MLRQVGDIITTEIEKRIAELEDRYERQQGSRSALPMRVN